MSSAHESLRSSVNLMMDGLLQAVDGWMLQWFERLVQESMVCCSTLFAESEP